MIYNYKKVGIVILNYNDWNETVAYCKAIIDYEILDKIVVVDNASTDESRIKLKQFLSGYDKVQVILSKENNGYAAGNNLGINYLIENDYSYIIISNPDIEVAEAVIKKMVDFVNDYKEKIGMCAPNAEEWGNPNPMTAWKLPNKSMMIKENFILFSRLQGDTRRYTNMSGDYFEVECLPGAFFMITSDAIKDVGGMDEETFLYCEEQILAFNVKKTGYKNYILPNIKYLHKQSTTIKKSIPQLSKRFRIAYDSNRVYCRKCLNMNRFELFLFDISYFLGTKGFLAILRVRNLFLKIKKN